MEAVQAVQAIAGSGLDGDRYQTDTGFYSARPRADGGRHLTLIEAEVLATLADQHGITLTAAESRRNLTTRGIRLAELIGQRFSIGAVVCEAVDHCPPCQHLVEVTGQPVLEPLVGRGGIRARIVIGGRVNVGDAITVIGAAEHQGAVDQAGARPA